MTRTEYMKSLEKLLAPLPETERRDALDYYDEYFDAAGKYREAETIAELGSPEEVAQKILENQDLVPAETPSAPTEPDSSPSRPVKKHRSHWKSIAACALLAVAGFAFVGAHLPFRRVVTTTAEETIVSPGTSNSPTYSNLAVENSSANSNSSSDSTFNVSLDCLKKLTIDLDMGNVKFVTEEGLTEARIEVKNRDNRLKTDFDFKESGSHFNYKAPKGFSLNPKSLKNIFTLTIYLPEGFEMDKLDANLDMGNLDFGSLKIKDLTAELDMGNCTADALTANTADFSLDMGNFTADSLDARSAEIDLSMGNLEITTVNAHDFTVDNDMGDIKIGLLTGAQKIDLDTDMGTIELTVDGSLPDYAVDASNDLGTLRVNGQKYSEKFKSSGPRELTLSNSMGSTTLNFQN